jgi:hypothetical protein
MPWQPSVISSWTSWVPEALSSISTTVALNKLCCSRTGDKTMRLHAQTAMIENGFVHIPETSSWLAEYLHEMTVFPKGNISMTTRPIRPRSSWSGSRRPWGIVELTRLQLQEREQRRKPPPVKTVWARGSMEWAAEQVKARSAAAPDPVPHTRPDIECLSAPNYAQCMASRRYLPPQYGGPAPAYVPAPGYSPTPSYGPPPGYSNSTTSNDLNRQELNRLYGRPSYPPR